MKKIIVLLSALLCGVLQIAGCGSGSTVSLPQQKNATVIFSAYTSAALPTAVRGIRITARIPAGVIVPLRLNSPREVDPAALIAYKPGSTLFGSYSAPLLTISVTGSITSPDGLGATNVRDFAGVFLTYQAGFPFAAGDFTSINSTFPGFNATGYTTSNGLFTSVNLTGQLKPALRVTF